MDYGLFDDQYHLAVHELDYREHKKRLELLPGGFDPYEGHYEETEADFCKRPGMVGGYRSKASQFADQIPLEFGNLSAVNPRTGNYHLRYFYGDYLNLGTCLGVKRGPACEAWKFNQRLNPLPNRVGNYPVHKTVTHRTEADMKAGCLAHFPNIAGLRTSALYKASGVKFSLDKVEQSSAFFTCWKRAELRALLVEELFGYAEYLSIFSRTCQEIRQGIEDEFGYFDTEHNNFGHCEKSAETLQTMLASGKLTQQQFTNIRVPKHLIIGPVRSPLEMAPGFHGDPTSFWPPDVSTLDEQGDPLEGEDLFNERGFREVVGYTRKTRDTAKRKCTALLRTLRSFFHHRMNFHYVAINRLDFLNTDTVEAIIDYLPNLKCLCIYSCPLIDLSQIRAIIQLVGKVNEERKRCNQQPLDLDIAPQLRQGPVGERYGSYGITHSDPKLYMEFGTDVGFALAANLVSLLRAADKAGIQLVHPGKAFRRWMDRLPLRINQSFALCRSAWAFIENEKTREEYAAGVYLDPEDEGIRPTLVQRFNDTVAIDLIVAARAKPLPGLAFVSGAKLLCGECNEFLPAMFFRRQSAARQPAQVRCEGCELNSQLRSERGNAIIHKRNIAAELWQNAPEISLDWLIGKEYSDARKNWASFADGCLALPSNDQCLEEAACLEAKSRRVATQLRSSAHHWRTKRQLQKKYESLEKEAETARIRAGLQRKPIVGQETDYNWDFLRKAYNWRGEVERGEFNPDMPYHVDDFDRMERHFCM